VTAAETSRITPHYASRALPELLAPAGDWECAKAAVENGADAIYFGLDKFNARMRAHNFTEADLPKLMEFLHRRGVKGYVTFNTLIFQNEIADAENYLRAIIAAGVDAAIVQDVGICRLIRSLSPDFPIHASTQMTISSAAGIEFARKLGCNLAVLARECSIAEIEKIHHATRAPLGVPPSGGFPVELPEGGTPNFFPLEVFVHGALCVAYSGQCLTSESLGGRSANRGECAQACRMPYDLISDGVPVPLGDKKYLLSPQDLAGLEVLPDLVRAGVASLKIEGRLKAPEYVASITRVYRAALDQIGHRGTEAQRNDKIKTSEPLRLCGNTEKYELEMTFSRGLFTGWFGGNDNQKLVHARFGKKRGVYLGEIKKMVRDGVIVNLAAPVKPGDGIVFDAGRPDEKEEGGRIYEIQEPRFTIPGETLTELRFGYGNIDYNRLRIGDKLWKTNDPELDKRLRQTFEGDAIRFQRPIEIEVHGLAGKPLTLIARDETGNVVKVESAMPLAKAEKVPLTEEKLRDQLGRLGGTPFKLGTLNNFLSGEVLVPVSELNRLRRECVGELEKLRAAPKRWGLSGIGSGVLGLGSAASVATPEPRPQTQDPALIVLVRNLPQLEAALQCGATTVYCEFEDPKKYREAVTQFHTARGCAAEFGVPPSGGPNRPKPELQTGIFVAPPRIFKMGEEWILNLVNSANADGVLVRNYDHLKFFADKRRVGDFSLNVANRLTADYFKNHFGLERVTASYDLNALQLDALLQAAPPEWFEVTIHQHMPMFHMEHCVFCAFLSQGKDFHDCGRPCDKHEVKLRDRVGAEHPLKADAGCRNTVFNSQAQTGAEFVERLLALGVRNFRVEFLNESPDEVVRTITKYRQLLRGEISGTQLWRELKLFNQLGVTRGQMGK
jgi:putative protease